MSFHIGFYINSHFSFSQAIVIHVYYTTEDSQPLFPVTHLVTHVTVFASLEAFILNVSVSDAYRTLVLLRSGGVAYSLSVIILSLRRVGLHVN